MEQVKIGERFESCGMIYEVQKEVNQCEGCSFDYGSVNFCNRPADVCNCTAIKRDDNKSVIFKLIGEAKH